MAFLKKAGRNSTNFFLGGRSIKWPVIGASLFATNIGAEHLAGLSGDSYRYGLSAGSVELTTAITTGFACSTLVVRDFIVEFRPGATEKKQVLYGRFIIILITLLGIGAAYMVYKNEEGIYK